VRGAGRRTRQGCPRRRVHSSAALGPWIAHPGRRSLYRRLLASARISRHPGLPRRWPAMGPPTAPARATCKRLLFRSMMQYASQREVLAWCSRGSRRAGGMAEVLNSSGCNLSTPDKRAQCTKSLSHPAPKWIKGRFRTTEQLSRQQLMD